MYNSPVLVLNDTNVQQHAAKMTYQEYRALRAEGKVKAGISVSRALQLGQHLPPRYQYETAFFNILSFLTIPAAIVVMYFHTWWSSLLILFLVTPACFSGTKKGAVNNVLRHAEEDEQFFNALKEMNLLTFRR